MRTVLAVDIGGTQVKAARVSEDGAVQESRRVDTPSSLAAFRAAVGGVLADLRAEDVQAIGFGCKGLVNAGSTVVEVLPGTLQYLEGFRLADLAPGLVAAADNDARVAMAGEMVWGAARGCRNAVMLTLGTGVGGAIVLDGRLVHGATGVAGHLGHYTIDVAGEFCICGNRGCLETVFSARAIESAAHAVAHRGAASEITVRSQSGRLSCQDVFAIAAAGDAIAIDIIARATRALAGAIAGLALAVDPEKVIVGGQIAGAGERLFKPLREEVWSRTRRMLRRELEIVGSGLADPTGVLGAAALALNRA